MTHSPNSNRKKRTNECDDGDFSHVQAIKRARTRAFDNNEISDVKDNVNWLPQTSNYNFSNATQNKDQQFFHHSSIPINNEFHRSISEFSAQADISSLSLEHSTMHQTNFKYLPDLNAIENPYYYENNKLLFELYVERLRRSACHSASTSHQF